MQAPDIGSIGLGVMGAPMATDLVRAGHRLTLHDAGAALAQRGVARADAPVSGAQWGAQEATLVFMFGGASASNATRR